MKLKRIISLCAVVVFGASTVIYAGNVSKTEEKTAEESFEQENKDSMLENEQLAGVELSMPENNDPGERETETTKKSMIEESTEQKKSIEETNVVGKVENNKNAESVPQETETEAFDPRSLIPPGKEEGMEGQLLKYTLFYYDGASAKQIVTKVNKDGTFLTEDLGDWLKKQDVYDISVLEENGVYKKLLYKSRPENQQREEFEPTDEVDCLYFDMLVSPGEYIMYWGGYTEMVDEVYADGSFTTEYISE